MLRALVLAAILAAVPALAAGQAQAVLHIKVALAAAGRDATPVPRHALLISDNPATSAPRRVVTGPDGAVDVRLRPGNYTIESEAPVAFNGKGYEWTQTIDLVAGRETLLELTIANAEVGAAPPVSASPAPENDPALLLPRWQGSVVSVWTPGSHASGFVVDAAGLVATNQRAIGSATAIEVQLSPSIKVSANVLVADRARDVAILWIDTAAMAAAPPIPFDCTSAPNAPTDGQKVVALSAPQRGPRDLAIGEVTRVEPRGTVADFRLPGGSTGGPVFDAAGHIVGLTSVVEDQDERRRRDTRIVPARDACEALASAKGTMQNGVRPAATLLPVEPAQAFPSGALDRAVSGRSRTLAQYQASSSDFDITFLTPVQIYDAQHDMPKTGATNVRGGSRMTDLQQGRPGAPTDFGDWSDYFADVPPVLAVRATPKLTEGFWTTVARGAAYTQGVSLPPIKHFKPGFARMRAFCGDVEVAPIHPFTLEQRVSETDAIREGLYVFDPQAFGPQCKSVKLGLYSEKEPTREDDKTIDPQVIERIWQDFAPYRARLASSDSRP